MKKSIIGAILAGTVIGGSIIGNWKDKKIKQKEEQELKYAELTRLLAQWVNLKQDKKELKRYFIENNFKQIAVYGVSYVGKCLIHELRNTEIEVAYVIDQRGDAIDLEEQIRLVHPDDEMEPVDAVIVTSVYYFEQIEKKMQEKIDCPIISISDIVFEFEMDL